MIIKRIFCVKFSDLDKMDISKFWLYISKLYIYTYTIKYNVSVSTWSWEFSNIILIQISSQHHKTSRSICILVNLRDNNWYFYILITISWWYCASLNFINISCSASLESFQYGGSKNMKIQFPVTKCWNRCWRWFSSVYHFVCDFVDTINTDSIYSNLNKAYHFECISKQLTIVQQKSGIFSRSVFWNIYVFLLITLHHGVSVQKPPDEKLPHLSQNFVSIVLYC